MKFFFIFFLLFSLGTKSQVPYGLSSHPSSRPTVFLDFDGQTVDDVYWRPFSTDSIIICKPSKLTNAQMIRVFNNVAEDFKPFNLNITTDSSVYFAAPITRRTRVIITPTWQWYGSAGGVAYIESFRWGLNTPCFVFDTLLKFNDKFIAEAVSHEIGHTLGLYHQSQYRNENTDTCRYVTEYNPGRGSRDIGWSPIMGVSYDRNLSLWHNGRNSFGCSSLQNDLSIIVSSSNSITYRSDDHGNNINTSTIVNTTNGEYDVNGLITDSTDTDHFQFQFNVPGRFISNIRPYNSGPPIQGLSSTGIVNYNGNVDLEVTLFKNNTQIATYNPSTLLNVTIDTLLEPGIYYLRVNSVANVNIFKGMMIGSYNISGSFGGSVVVPIYEINLNARNNKLFWNVVTDEPIQKIYIEYSKDGSKFELYKELIGLSGSLDTKKENSYYKLVAITSSGSIKYSKIIYHNSGKSDYELISNIIHNNIIINANKNYGWVIYDVNGKLISKGSIFLGQNKIDLNFTKGVYFLQLIDRYNLYTEKIIKL
jgi:hypothetical protein